MAKWLDKYEQGGLVLKQKTKDNYGKKPNPNDVTVSTGPDYVGSGYDVQGRDYSPAWGGQFEDGGNIAQGGKSIPVPTTEDSLMLYKNQLLKDAFYRNNKDYVVNKLDKSTIKNINKSMPSFLESINKTYVNKTLDKEQAERINEEFGTKSSLSNLRNRYKKVSDNVYSVGDIVGERGVDFYFNPKAPPLYFSNVVKPETWKTYYSGKFQDISSVPTYDPFAIKPYHMRTDEEKLAWEKKYGKKTPTKKSEETKPAPYTPKGSKKYIVNGMEVSEEDFLGVDNTTGGSKRIIYNTPNKGTQKVLRLDGTPETDPEKIRKALATANKDDNMAMGGSLPGAVGFTYARTAGSAPSNGKYAKKTKASAQNGKEMQFYQEGLDFKPNSIAQDGEAIVDPMGQWAHPGEVTIIPSTDITMEGVDYPVLGISDTGDQQMMYPGEDYQFDGDYVTEYPMMKEGGWLSKYQDGGGGLSRSNLAMMAALTKDIKNQKARNAQETVSQYTPKSGDQQRMNAAKDAYRAEEAKPLNKLANNPHVEAAAKNLPGAVEFALDVMTAGEATAALNTVAKPILKAAGKYITKKKGLKNASNLNSYAKINSAELPPPLPEPNLSIVPRGNYLESELTKGNKISLNDVDKLGKKEIDWLQSDEYFNRRSAATGESASEIQKDVDEIINRWGNLSVSAANTGKDALGFYGRGKNRIVISDKLNRKEALPILDHEVKHALSQMGGLKGFQGYKNYPTTKVDNWLNRTFGFKNANYYAEPWEQQVRGLRLLDFIEKTQGVPRGTKLSAEDITQFAKNVAPSSTSKEIMELFDKDYNDVVSQLFKMKAADTELKFIPSNIKKLKSPFQYERKGNLRENILDWLNKTYAVPVGVGVGAGTLGSDEEVPKQKDGGWLTKYK
jgi:hypothetical protein